MITEDSENPVGIYPKAPMEVGVGRGLAPVIDLEGLAMEVKHLGDSQVWIDREMGNELFYRRLTLAALNSAFYYMGFGGFVVCLGMFC
jgi:hypothetical protein